MLFQHARSRQSELFGEESSVVSDNQRGSFLLSANVAGDCRGGTADTGKIKIVGDHAAPAGSAEMDGLAGHGRLLYLGARTVSTKESRAGESQE
jgi:hypothetical protein